MEHRKLTQNEENLLGFLIGTADNYLSLKNWQEGLLVSNMNDDGMGSLMLFPQNIDKGKKRKFGEQISECWFLDQDNIKVIASLNLDEEGNLFELDIWKTDFSPLKKIPNSFNQRV